MSDSREGAPLPAAGQTIDLHWMSGDELRSATARIASSSEDRFRVILSDPEVAGDLPAAARVAVLYDAEGVPCQARARPVVDGDAVALELSAPPRMRDRREFLRVWTTMKLVAEPSKSLTAATGIAPVPSGEPIEQRVNLSASGMVLTVDFDARPGAAVDLLLYIGEGEQPIAVQAEVVGRRSDGLAVQFSRPGAHVQERIVDLVHQRYLQALTAE